MPKTVKIEDYEPKQGLDINVLDVAVLIPCLNEEISIGKVVEGFRTSVPNARIYVYDNNSTDQTMAVARTAGAIVRNEPQQGVMTESGV